MIGEAFDERHLVREGNRPKAASQMIRSASSTGAATIIATSSTIARSIAVLSAPDDVSTCSNAGAIRPER